MNLTRILALLALTPLLHACVTQPKTADDLRNDVKRNAVFASHDQFEVKKPYRQVSETVKKRWMECFDTRTAGSYVSSGSMGGMPGTISSVTYIYTPTSNVTSARTELALQQRAKATGLYTPGGPPPDGFFIMVTDIYPAGNNATRVDIQKRIVGFGDVMKVVRQWAEGTGTGCPTLQ